MQQIISTVFFVSPTHLFSWGFHIWEN